MKINGKNTGESRAADDKKKARDSRDTEGKRSFKELLRDPERESTSRKNEAPPSKGPKEEAPPKASLTAEGQAANGELAKESPPRREGLSLAKGEESVAQRERGEFRARPAREETDGAGFQSGAEDGRDEELSPEDARSLMKGAAPGVAPAPDADVASVKTAQPLAPSQSKHEVTEKLLATIVSEGYVAEDVKGRKVVMMQVDIPGRGTVNMRLWRKSSGVELRMRADDPALAGEIRRNRAKLEAGARERGIQFSSIEVAG